MAERRATRQIRAREKARALNAERREREQKLEDLATEWFTAEDEIAGKESAAEEKIRKYAEKVRGQVEKETGKLRGQMTGIVARMLELTGVRSVAESLGLPEGDVREIKASQDAAKANRVDAVSSPQPIPPFAPPSSPSVPLLSPAPVPRQETPGMESAALSG